MNYDMNVVDGANLKLNSICVVIFVLKRFQIDITA